MPVQFGCPSLGVTVVAHLDSVLLLHGKQPPCICLEDWQNVVLWRDVQGYRCLCSMLLSRHRHRCTLKLGVQHDDSSALECGHSNASSQKPRGRSIPEPAVIRIHIPGLRHMDAWRLMLAINDHRSLEDLTDSLPSK